LFSLLAVGGYRRLLLLEHNLDGGACPAEDGHELVFLSAADAVAFNPAWAGGIAEARIEGGHRCVGLSDGRSVLSAWWVAHDRAWIPYLGCSFDPGPGSAFLYDATTPPACRGNGSLAIGAQLYSERLREEGGRRAVAAVLPENAAGYASFARAGFGPVATLTTVWGHGPRLSSARVSLPHMAPARRSRFRRLREPVMDVVPGDWWGGVRPRRPLASRGALRAVVIHHTAKPAAALAGAGPRAEAEYLRGIERGHLLRGWWAIGYHYIVMPSGRVFAGRPPRAMGAHVQGHNRGTLGIALAGDFDFEHPAAEALRALDRLLAALPDVPVVGHRDLADTSCPGRYGPVPARSRSAPAETLST
jgi:hypothetical protein